MSPDTYSYSPNGNHSVVDRFGFSNAHDSSNLGGGVYEIICGQSANALQFGTTDPNTGDPLFLKHIGQQTVTFTTVNWFGNQQTVTVSPTQATLGGITGYWVQIGWGELTQNAVPTIVPYEGGSTAGANIVNAGEVTTQSAQAEAYVISWPAPSVAISSPTGTTTVARGSSVPLAATASTSATGTIDWVCFYDGGTYLGDGTFDSESGTWTYAWDTAGSDSGLHNVTAEAYDNLWFWADSAPVAIVIDILPMVSIASPTSGYTGAVGTNVPLTATASDADGTVTGVEFFDGESDLGPGVYDPSSTVAWRRSALAGSMTRFLRVFSKV